MAINWDDYNLPSFIRGSTRTQPVPFKIETPFVGNAYTKNCNDYISQLPVRWRVSLTLDKQQAFDFNVFLDDYYAQDELLFTKKMFTEVGINTHTLTIMGARPQGQSNIGNTWTYSFDIYSDFLDLTTTPVPPLVELPPTSSDNKTPEPFQLMPIQGEFHRSSSCSRDNLTAVTVNSYDTINITKDGGETWKQENNTFFLINESMISNNGQVILFSSLTRPQLKISTDGGTTYTTTQPFVDSSGEPYDYVNAALSGDGNGIFVLGTDGVIFKSENSGGFFYQLNDLANSSLIYYNISVSNNGQFLIVSGADKNLISTNGGLTFESVPTENDERYFKFVGDDGFLVTTYKNKNTISISEDYGTNEKEYDARANLFDDEYNLDDLAVDPINKNILAFFSNGEVPIRIALSKNKGVSWTDFGTYGAEQGITQTNTSCASSTFFMAFSTAGFISSETYEEPEEPTNPYLPGRAPTNWEQVTPRYLNSGQTGGGPAAGAMAANGTDIYYGANSGSGSTSKDTANTWQIITEYGFGIESAATSVVSANSMACSDNGQYNFVACEDGYIFRTSDGGITWDELQRGAGMPLFTSDIDTVCCSGDGLTVFAGGGNQQGGISYNGGDTWISVEGLSENLVISSCMSKDGQLIFVGHYDGYVSFSKDAGNTFTEIQQGIIGNGSTFLSCKMSYDGKTIIAVKNSGGVVISKDFGETWILKATADLNMGITNPSNIVAGISYDGEVILLGANSGYVSYSSDGGVTFNTLERGLGSGSVSSAVSDILTNGNNWMVVFTAGRSSISRG